MKLQGSIELFQYWSSLRGSRPAPARGEISPAAIKGLLSDLFILGLGAKNAPSFRLAGTRLCATHGRELKDVPFAALWRLRDRALAIELCRQSFEQKTPFVISYQGRSQGGRNHPFELLLLPLAGDSPRILGAVATAERPFWLGTDPLRQNSLHAYSALDPSKQGSPLVRPSPPLAPRDDELRPIVSTKQVGRRVGHLVVYRGGRDE